MAPIIGFLLTIALMFYLTGWHLPQEIILVISTIIAGFPILIKAIQALRMKAFSIELLVSITIIGALFIGEYVESAVVSFLFLFGTYLEARTLEQTRSSLKKLMDMAPLEATVLRDGVRRTLLVEDVLIGDLVAIQSGEKVVVDGKVVSGQAFINEAAITGESVPFENFKWDILGFL
jgi:Cd2+/Zn2+-exporting ATPase